MKRNSAATGQRMAAGPLTTLATPVGQFATICGAAARPED